MANYKDFVFFVLSEHLLLISGEQKFRYGGQYAFELPDRGAFDSDGSDKQKCSKLPTKQHVHVKTSHIGSFARMTVYTIYISIWNLIKYFFETNNKDSYLSSAIPHE